MIPNRNDQYRLVFEFRNIYYIKEKSTRLFNCFPSAV